MIRETIANSFISTGRSLGRLMGLELAVVQSDHSLELHMEQPDQSKRAWDTSMFKHGNLFLQGYSNPIKNRVNQNPDLENPNTVEVEESDQQDDTQQQEPEETTEVITSSRYQEFMRQNLISQLLTPESRWNLLVWAVVGLGVLQFLAIMITMWATGSF